jgi:hypothetical protein
MFINTLDGKDRKMKNLWNKIGGKSCSNYDDVAPMLQKHYDTLNQTDMEGNSVL